jgi:hypothetical protein
MRIIAECPTCHDEVMQEGKIPEQGQYLAHLVENVAAEIDDNFLAYFTCSKGHTSIGYLSKHRFEVLLQSGLLAYMSGFHGESVLSFAASLERLFELFIRAALHKRGISFDDVDTAWNQIKKQSERQLGAFCLLYLLETGKPYVINTKVMEFRNKVVHQGYVPTSQEVAEWADQVVNIIFDIVTELRSNYRESLTQITFNRGHGVNKALSSARARNPALSGAPVATISTPSLVGLDLPDDAFRRETFPKLLAHMERLKAKFVY